MEGIVITVLGLMGLLAIVSLMLPIARRFYFPYTVLLAAVGIALGIATTLLGERQTTGLIGDFFTALGSFEITAETVLFVFLPTLIFESALSINVRDLLHDLVPILVLAVIGLLVSATVVGFAMWWSTATVPLVACLLLGAIVSATDPVAVIALFKELGAPKRLTILVEGESLFNDATAIVLFTILAGMLVGGREADVVAGTAAFLTVFVGGIVVGLVSAVALCVLIGHLRNVHLAEITLTVSLAYLVFLLAEHYLHVSGVMAVVTAGLVMGSYGRTKISPHTWPGLIETWEQLSFWATSLVFVLVGLTVPHLLSDISASEIRLLGILIVVALVIRAVLLYGLLPTLSMTGLAERVSRAYITVMMWGGLRGAVSLALALAVLETPGLSDEIKHFVVVLVTGFALFTLFVNATTMRPLVHLFGLDTLSPAEVAVRNRALALALEKIRDGIQQVATEYRVGESHANEVAAVYAERLAAIETGATVAGDLSEDDRLYVGLTYIVDHERQFYLTLFSDGVVSDGIARRLLGQVDDVLDGLKLRGVAGFERAIERSLGFSFVDRAALRAQRKWGLSGLLVHRLADRFEVLLVTDSMLRAHMAHVDTTMSPLLGETAGRELQRLFEERFRRTDRALAALKLQYPDYSEALQTRLLGRVALRQEEASYRSMLEESMISHDVYVDLETDLRKRAHAFERRPVLDLGLDPERLVAKVPLFAELPTERIAEIAALLKPHLVLPGEKLIREGETGDAMYFVASGAVEVAVAPEPVRLGTGEFFGEIALVSVRPCTADVTALSYCNLLALFSGDFHRMLDANPVLRETINRTAEQRLASQEPAVDL